MSLLLMKKNPLASAVAIYDQYGGNGQILYDKSGHGNNAQLGSTASADTNDPTWTGISLQYNTDDYRRATIPQIQLSKWTAIIVGKFSGTSGTYFSLGNISASDQYVKLVSGGSGSVFCAFKSASSERYTTTLTVTTTDNIALKLTTDGINVKLKRLDNGSEATGGCTQSITGSATLSVGNESSTSQSIINSFTEYYTCIFPEILADARTTRAYNYIKSLLVGRGITI